MRLQLDLTVAYRVAAQVELQAVALVVLSFFRNAAAGAALADTVRVPA